MTDPIRPLTPAQLKVAGLVSRGADYDMIAFALEISPRTAAVHVHQIAQLLPNPDGLKPYTLVLLWAAHDRWIRDRETAA